MSDATITYETLRLSELEFEKIPAAEREYENEQPSRRRRGRKKIPKQRVRVCVNGEMHNPGPRFWRSLSQRYGFNENIFRYFPHEEVFRRVAKQHDDDELRVAIQQPVDGMFGTLLATSNPTKPVLGYDHVMEMLRDHGAKSVKYADGVITSHHNQRVSGGSLIHNGDEYRRGFQMSIPVDGWGRPGAHLMLLRLVCTNGMIGEAPSFFNDCAIGKGSNLEVLATLDRFMRSFNNDAGFDAISRRIISAGNSHASVSEAFGLYNLLAKHSGGISLVGKLEEKGLYTGNDATIVYANDQAMRENHNSDRRYESFIHIQRQLREVTGDIKLLYGLANPEDMSQKRQRSLPMNCTMYDLINFATEISTHNAEPQAARAINAWVGQTISGEYDLENSKDRYSDFRAFFVKGNEQDQKLLE